MVNQVGARQLEVAMRRFAKWSTNSSRGMSIPSYSRCLMHAFRIFSSHSEETLLLRCERKFLIQENFLTVVKPVYPNSIVNV
jgi:hypothetical protein